MALKPGIIGQLGQLNQNAIPSFLKMSNQKFFLNSKSDMFLPKVKVEDDRVNVKHNKNEKDKEKNILSKNLLGEFSNI